MKNEKRMRMAHEKIKVQQSNKTKHQQFSVPMIIILLLNAQSIVLLCFPFYFVYAFSNRTNDDGSRFLSNKLSVLIS